MKYCVFVERNSQLPSLETGRFFIFEEGSEKIEQKGKIQQDTFFAEIGIALQRIGCNAAPSQGELCEVSYEGLPLCKIMSTGSVRYRENEIGRKERSNALYRVIAEAQSVAEYVRLMQNSPVLKADGLHGEYKMLADYNDTVLAGRQTKYGIQFITWDWSYKHSGVTQGHYWDGDYQAAKQDFAVRSGLVKRSLIFKDEQLTEMYRCIQDTLNQDFDLTREQRHLLEGTQEQITDLFPELSQNPNQSHEQEETDFSCPTL